MVLIVACSTPRAPNGAVVPVVLPRGGTAALLRSMTPRERIAQLVMPWMAGTYAASDDPSFMRARTWVDSLGVGGIITSTGSPMDVASRLSRLQHHARIPLLLAADLESGAAFRFAGATPFPTNMGVAATGDVNDAYAMGTITALEGRAIGVRLVFAPVADVNSNPDNPIINTRSFGANAARVGALVAEEVRGLQEHGTFAVVKHFPGHGDTDVDSHLALPSLPATWSRLDSLELVPFRAAVRAGVTGIMSAHIALPQMGAGVEGPATLSPAVLTGMLRDSLHFRGLAITDALDMAGVVNRYGADEAPVLALLAGADLLLQPTDPVAAVAAVERAVASGRLTMERIDRSVLKVLELKQKLGLFADRDIPLDNVMPIVGNAEHLATARAIARRSIVLAKDDGGAVDSLRARRRSVSVVVYGDDAAGTSASAFITRLRARGDTVRVQRITPASGQASYDSARATLSGTAWSIVAIAVRPSAARGRLALPPAFAQMVDSMAATRVVAVVSFGSPYIVRQLPRARSVMFAWATNALSDEAAADALVDGAIGGTLPIPIPPLFELGVGLQRNSLATTINATVTP